MLRLGAGVRVGRAGADAGESQILPVMRMRGYLRGCEFGSTCVMLVESDCCVSKALTEKGEEMTDPIADIIGDYRVFAAQQRDRLLDRGIDIAPYPLSHLAFRVPEWDQYLHVRALLERHAGANSEKVWNGRPISLLVLREPLEVLDGKVVAEIELIPPVHQRVYKMGLEHLGVVVGDDFDAFSREHRSVLTGQQFQSETVEPVYILFEDFTHVKFYRCSLRAGIEDQGGRFDGFQHVTDWVPQHLVTATGPNPLPR